MAKRIRKDDVTVVDFLGYAARFFLTSQQYYEFKRKWSKGNMWHHPFPLDLRG